MLAGRHVNLWAVEPFDLPAIREWVADPELVRLAGLSPLLAGGGDLDQWFLRTQSDPTLKVFVIKSPDGAHLGNIELSAIDQRRGSAELGVFLGRAEARRKGGGRDAVRTLLRFAFRELNLHRVAARVTAYNEGGAAFFRACGFVEEGREREAYLTGGTYWDVICFGMLDRECPGKEPG